MVCFLCSRNASTLSSSDLLALITIVQDLYPSNPESDETPSEVGYLLFLSSHSTGILFCCVYIIYKISGNLIGKCHMMQM